MPRKVRREAPSNVLSLMMSTRWAITRSALERMVALADRDWSSLVALEDEDSDGGTSLALQHSPRWALLGRPAVAHTQSPRLGIRDGVAILPIVGPCCRYASFFQQVCGMTSYQLAAEDLRIALDDPSVRSILVHFDSPGGETNGLAEMAAMVADARGVKPIVAMVSDGAGSAAYWLASACDEIVVTPSAYVGSIGCYWEVEDWSGAEAEIGLKRYRIVSSQSPNKVPDPATAAGMAVMQREVDEFADAFLVAAAGYRNTTPEQLIAAGDGGGIFIGRFAVERGLADRVSTTEALLAELAAGRTQTTGLEAHATRPAPAAVVATHQESVMSKPAKPVPAAARPNLFVLGASVVSLVGRDAAVAEHEIGTIVDVRERVTAVRVEHTDGRDGGWLLAEEEVAINPVVALGEDMGDEEDDEVEGAATGAAAAEGEGGEEEEEEEEVASASSLQSAEREQQAQHRAEIAALAQSHPAVVARIRQQAVQAERQRVLALCALDERQIGATLKTAITAGDTPGRAAQKLLAAKAGGAHAALAAITGAEAALTPPKPGAPAAPKDVAASIVGLVDNHNQGRGRKAAAN